MMIAQGLPHPPTYRVAATLNRDSKAAGDYWWPLYAFVRRRGYEPHDAEDLVQEFFARLLAKDFLHSVDRRKGKFRSFLLAAMDQFLAKEWRRSNAQKRGGRFRITSLDAEAAEEHYLQIPATTQTPEQIYDYQHSTFG